jgi:hypothetical protein
MPHNLYKEIEEQHVAHIYYGLGFLAGIPGAMEILNSIEGSLENVPTSILSSDNDTAVPDSTNMVVIEMASLALPA